jgi:hypothetical protein
MIFNIIVIMAILMEAIWMVELARASLESISKLK